MGWRAGVGVGSQLTLLEQPVSEGWPQQSRKENLARAGIVGLWRYPLITRQRQPQSGTFTAAGGSIPNPRPPGGKRSQSGSPLLHSLCPCLASYAFPSPTPSLSASSPGGQEHLKQGCAMHSFCSLNRGTLQSAQHIIGSP